MDSAGSAPCGTDGTTQPAGAPEESAQRSAQARIEDNLSCYIPSRNDEELSAAQSLASKMIAEEMEKRRAARQR